MKDLIAVLKASTSFGDFDPGPDLLQGSRLQFTEDKGGWLQEGAPMTLDREWFGLGATMAVRRWQNEEIVDTKRKEGRTLDQMKALADELNSNIPESEWEAGFNGKRPPYKVACFVYLMDPVSMEVATYIGDTVGAQAATFSERSGLIARVDRMRSLIGKPVNPFLRLGERPMPTRFKTIKQRPDFIVQRWRNLIDGEETQTPLIASPHMLERINPERISQTIDSAREKPAAAAKPAAAPKSLRDDLDDEIPI
jgi:hypothetical protein